MKTRLLILGGFAFCLGVFGLVAPPWMAQWGSTAEERARVLPSDEVYWPPPADQETRAITVRAPAAVTWAWLIRIGQGRGGFYSYDWLENLFGDDIHNGADLLPAGPLSVGDTIRLTQPGYPGAGPGLTALPVVAVQGRYFVLKGWGAFVVESLAPRQSRIIVRERPRPPANAVEATVRALVWDPVHFVMERQMLRGIRDRAEGAPAPPLGAVLATGGFLLAAVAAATLIWRRRRSWWLVPPAALAALVVGSTGGIPAALAGFVALSVPGVLRVALSRGRWLVLTGLLAVVLLVILAAPDAYLALGWIVGGVVLGLFFWSEVSGKRVGTPDLLPVH